ncbi:hypothetical protein [Candidatus Scalindua japonica]|nr:hypothetical protein [Candidatus Scalindua japonica]
MLNGSNIHYEMGEKVKAISCGGIGPIHKMVLWCRLVKEINAMRLPVRDLKSNWAYMVIAALAWNLKLGNIRLNITVQCHRVSPGLSQGVQ